MTMMTTIADRATICSGCHVGAPADLGRSFAVRDMNHDMIAAGHPRLNFDFGEFMRRLPRHWHQANPASPVREWLIGRVVHAEAACKLAVYLHGLAGDLAEAAEGEVALTPSDVLAQLGDAVLDLTGRKQAKST